MVQLGKKEESMKNKIPLITFILAALFVAGGFAFFYWIKTFPFN